jgi:hypothetical protein
VLGALNFSTGSGTEVQVPYNSKLELGTGDFTIDAWINFQYLGTIVSHWVNPRAGAAGYQLFLDVITGSGSAISVGVMLNKGGFDFDPSTCFVTPNTWTHFAVTANSGVFRCYLNGTLADTQSSPYTSLNTPPGTPFEIGNGSGVFNGGTIDELEVFDRALSGAEVYSIYAAGSAGKCKSVALYPVTGNVNPVLAGVLTGPGLVADGGYFILAATPNPGYFFVSFSGDVPTTSTNPLGVTVNGPMVIGANFTPIAPALSVAATGARTDGTAAGTRNVPLTLTNAGAGPGFNAQIASIASITVVTCAVGATCPLGTVVLASGVPGPSPGVTLAPGASTPVPLVFNWPTTALRVSFVFKMSATGATGTSYTTTQSVTINR